MAAMFKTLFFASLTVVAAQDDDRTQPKQNQPALRGLVEHGVPIVQDSNPCTFKICKSTNNCKMYRLAYKVCTSPYGCDTGFRQVVQEVYRCASFANYFFREVHNNENAMQAMHEVAVYLAAHGGTQDARDHGLDSISGLTEHVIDDYIEGIETCFKALMTPTDECSFTP